MGKRAILWVVAVCFAAFAAGPAGAETNILFILDVSNSMWGQVDGVAKIETAKGVLAELLGDLGGDTKAGLMAYGHRSEGDCTDIEVISPIGAEPADAIAAKLLSFKPRGKTPIAGALEQAGAAFAQAANANNNVVLISDGVESCGGDPCATAAALAAAGVHSRVHVVGFDIGAEERAQLECIAAQGNGRYVDAANSDAFKAAIAEVTQVAQAAELEPAPQVAQTETWVEAFRDDFEGADLAEHWQVSNPSPDNFVVEDGSLVVIAKHPGGLSSEAAVNLFKLDQTLPDGDWRMTLTFSAELQTARETVGMGLYNDHENYISAYLYGWDKFTDVGTNNYEDSVLLFGVAKRSSGERTYFERPAWAPGNQAYPEYAKAVKMPISLRLIKEGREFRAAITTPGYIDQAGNPYWLETEAVSSLRPPKSIALNLGQWEQTTGESVFLVDSLVIETPGE